MTLKRAILFTALSTVLVAAAMPASAGRKRTRSPTTNTAPVISGTPSASVQATTAYSFSPKASDAQNNPLAFYISNKPAWATFSSSTGKLSGTPSGTQTGTYSNISISVSDGSLSSYLPAFSVTVTPPITTPTNSAPVITGTPATAVTVGSTYSFAPKATDADGNMLAFSISGKPAWAIFSTATGSVSGTPDSQQAGIYAGIGISVSDGIATSSLPAFTITVNQAAVSGSATLSWSPPTLNTDGTALTNLAGFKIYHGTSANTLSDVVDLQGSGWTAYTYPQLGAGTHYFAVSAYSSAGAESLPSAVGSKLVQ